MNLELKHIAPYLPYGLKAEMLDYKSDYVGKQYDEIVGVHQWDKNCLYWSALTIGGSKPNIERIRPILRPLSDLTKEIEHNGERFVPIDELEININWYSLEQWKHDYKIVNVYEYNKLIEWHFDVFSLIEHDLAIDINTLEL